MAPAEEKAIDEIILHMSPPPYKPVTISHVLEKWNYVVEKVERGYTQSIWDLQNDFTPRDFLKRVLDSCPPALRSKLAVIVDELDRRFYAATSEAKEPAVGPKAAFSKEQFPWHYRVPTSRKDQGFESVG